MTDARDASEALRARCNRCPAVPWVSISQPSQETVLCSDATVEMLACKRHLSVVLFEDFDHEWEPREVHLLLWDENSRAEELAAFPPQKGD